MTVGLLFPSPSLCQMRAATVYFQERLAGQWKTHPDLHWVETSQAPLSRAEGGKEAAMGGCGGNGFRLMALFKAISMWLQFPWE